MNFCGCYSSQGNMEIILKTNLKWEIFSISYTISYRSYYHSPAAEGMGHLEARLLLIMINFIKDDENWHNVRVATDMLVEAISFYFCFEAWTPRNQTST